MPIADAYDADSGLGEKSLREGYELVGPWVAVEGTMAYREAGNRD